MSKNQISVLLENTQSINEDCPLKGMNFAVSGRLQIKNNKL